MSQGYVYILSNPAMPGVCKIGKTTHSPEDRARQLDQTGVPMPFVVEFSCLSPDCGELEALMHEAITAKRVRLEREFFHIQPEEAKAQLRSLLESQVSEFVDRYLPAHTIIHCADELELRERAAQ